MVSTIRRAQPLSDEPVRSWPLTGYAYLAFCQAEQPLRTITAGHIATEFPVLTDELARLGRAAAQEAGLPEPRAAIAHGGSFLAEHTDKRNPYACLNLLVVYRDPDTVEAGGHLQFRDRLVMCHHSWAYVFDGQEPHAVTNVVEGWRVGLTFYCPADGQRSSL